MRAVAVFIAFTGMVLMPLAPPLHDPSPSEQRLLHAASLAVTSACTRATYGLFK